MLKGEKPPVLFDRINVFGKQQLLQRFQVVANTGEEITLKPEFPSNNVGALMDLALQAVPLARTARMLDGSNNVTLSFEDRRPDRFN